MRSIWSVNRKDLTHYEEDFRELQLHLFVLLMENFGHKRSKFFRHNNNSCEMLVLSTCPQWKISIGYTGGLLAGSYDGMCVERTTCYFAVNIVKTTTIFLHLVMWILGNMHNIQMKYMHEV